MRVAVAGIPGAWSTELLATSLRAQGADAFTFSLADIVHDVTTGCVALNGEPLTALDAVAIKKLGSQDSATTRLGLHALRALERGGVRVFSPADVTDVAMDRYRMTMVLAGGGLPVPKTIAVTNGEGLTRALAQLPEAVVKPVYTSKGRGMFRVRPGDPAPPVPDVPVLVQEFVAAPGRDIGATVVGGRFAGAFFRIAQPDEWMTTTARGGRYAPCQLSRRGIEYAERAAQLFGLDYTVVDLVEQGDDFLLYEVSAFGGFRGLYEACEIDASVFYARHIIDTLSVR